MHEGRKSIPAENSGGALTLDGVEAIDLRDANANTVTLRAADVPQADNDTLLILADDTGGACLAAALVLAALAARGGASAKIVTLGRMFSARPRMRK